MKMILISLVVLLGLFMLVGMYYSFLLFLFVIKLICWAIIIGSIVYIFFRPKK